jgi:hypothetical protein
MPSRRKFGIELETSYCEGYTELEGDDAWGAKDDCSVSGKEFYSDILYGDRGLDAINRLCKFAGEINWVVDRACGYHAHFDMRSETTDSMKAIALAYLLSYDVWCSFVKSARVGAYYCATSSSSINDISNVTDWDTYSCALRRYCWINFASYYVHKTFEVRLHHGTLDGVEVCNWVRAHATFMDWASKVGWDEVKNCLLRSMKSQRFEFLCKIWHDAGCDDLEEYYRNKL